jgi:hypothetical protein
MSKVANLKDLPIYSKLHFQGPYFISFGLGTSKFPSSGPVLIVISNKLVHDGVLDT